MNTSATAPDRLAAPGNGFRSGDATRFLLATVVVAVLDLSYAGTYWVLIRGKSTIPRILQSIAAGLLGKEAFQGGAGTVALGAALHCVVAAGWTAIFLLLARRWVAFGRVLQGPYGALKTGMPYGIVVWLVMNLLVVRLSRATPAVLFSAWFNLSLLWHAVGVGLPIAVVVKLPGGSRT